MKKILIILCFCLCISGCGNYTVKDVEKDLEKKIGKINSYNLSGKMEIINNDDVYKYDVDVSYKKGDKYRVSLKNKTNNHEQIILRNSDGVYVLTPTLGKSFKFQSDWPYNNSQVYLLQTLLSDIQNDSKKEFKNTSKNYIFKTKVNYPNNSDLVSQKIYFDKKLNPLKVEVLNNEEDVLIKMNFDKINLKPKFSDNYFMLDENMEVSKSVDNTEMVSKIDEEIYPMYIPQDTKLTNKEKISLGDGERVIMTFEGASPFMLIEQTASISSDESVVSVDGEPYQMAMGVGMISDNMVSFISGGIEYYVVSDNMSDEELISVANSISVLPASK
ncbi:MAG: outer membrane lipoprotein carrier protein LolA [Bacilli bacterium]|nr:outer membrane lipoprotein carrier protein LolA [Bacilli bacterium]